MDYRLFAAQACQNYMAWAACPPLNDLLLSSSPAVALSPEGEKVLWANPQGALRLGGNKLAELVGSPLPETLALQRQAKHLSPRLKEGYTQIQRLRLGKSALAPLEFVNVQKIQNHKGETGLLFTPVCEEPAKTSPQEQAQKLTGWLAASGLYAALLSSQGAVVATCGAFYQLRHAAQDLEALLELADDNGGSATQRLEAKDNTGYWVSAAKIRHQQGDYFLLTACPLPGLSQNRLEERKSSNTAAEKPDQKESASEQLMRFVWRMDDALRFSFVSPEFQALVNLRGAFEGRTWQDIAGDYGLDPEGVIQKALQSKDMWNKKNFIWPLPKRGLKLHIELSAMPVFGGRHLFQGYRGFGACRTKSLPPHSLQAQKRQPSSGPEQQSTLTRAERSAFDELAHTLRTKLDSVPIKSPQKPALSLKREAGGPSLEATVLQDKQTARLNAFQDILSRLPYGILITQDEHIAYANKTAANLTGYSDVGAFMAKHRASGMKNLLFGPSAEEKGAMLLRRADGGLQPVKIHIGKTSWNGAPASLLVLEQSAEQNEAKTAQGQWSAEELLSILDTATEGVLMINAQGQILALNHSAEALFAENSEELRKQKLLDLLAPESHKTALDYLKNLLGQGVASLLNDGREVIGRTAQGGYMPLFMTMSRIGESDPARLCVVLRDITQWKRAEDELIAARHKAERENAAKSEFLTRISHEIRTPLNAILGFSEVMLEERFGPIHNPRYKEYIQDIQTSAIHMINLVSDLLDISKIEANQMELNFAAVNLISILKECVALMQPQANEAKLIIRTSFGEALPRIVADAKTLRQITLNLLSNAVKFTNPGGQVVVSAFLEQNGEVVFKVRDTGMGMSETDMLTAMQPFRQLKSLAKNAEKSARDRGTGLGLPLTKALVEANRAQFHIKSKPAEGTLIRITFPNTRVLAE